MTKTTTHIVVGKKYTRARLTRTPQRRARTQRPELGCLSPLRTHPHQSRTTITTAQIHTYVFERHTPPVAFPPVTAKIKRGRATLPLLPRNNILILLMIITSRTCHGQAKVSEQRASTRSCPATTALHHIENPSIAAEGQLAT